MLEKIMHVRNKRKLRVRFEKEGAQKVTLPRIKESTQQVIWIDSLGLWIPTQRPQDRNYVTFVESPPTIEKFISTSSTREHVAHPPLAPVLKEPSLKPQQDEVFFKTMERKAYSSPLSNAESRRTHFAPICIMCSSSELNKTPEKSVTPAWVSPDEESREETEEAMGHSVVEYPSSDGPVSEQCQQSPLVGTDTDSDLILNEADKHIPLTMASVMQSRFKNVKSIRTSEPEIKQNIPVTKPPAQKVPKSRKTAIKQQRRSIVTHKQSRVKQNTRQLPSTGKQKTVRFKQGPTSSKPSISSSKPSISSPTVNMPKISSPLVNEGVASDVKSPDLPESLPVVTTMDSPITTPSMTPDSESASIELAPEMSEPDEEETSEVAVESPQHLKRRSPIKKRERILCRPCRKEEVTTEVKGPPVFEKKKSPEWIFGDEDDEDGQNDEMFHTAGGIISLPSVETPTSVVPRLPSTLNMEVISRIKLKMKSLRKPVEAAIKKRWGPRRRDTSYFDNLRKQELGEERRRNQAAKMERFRRKRFQQGMVEEGIDEIPNFEDYGFLSKYCILNRTNLEMYKRAFQAVDDKRRGWLTGVDAMIALKGTNNQLTETEEEYLYRILELTGYNISKGADFKLFSVLASLSQRITALDCWMKTLIGQVDFKALEMKMFMCKNLWECNVDANSNKITLEQLMIELRVGGVSLSHEREVREKLAHLQALDLLDFLTYIPLFIMIHESVVHNPLDDSREK